MLSGEVASAAGARAGRLLKVQMEMGASHRKCLRQKEEHRE